jgi:hypothetical protein
MVPSQIASFGSAFTISKSDTVGQHFNALYIGGTGDVVVVLLDGSTVTFKAVPVGSILPIMGQRVNSTNTTATLMLGLA